MNSNNRNDRTIGEPTEYIGALAELEHSSKLAANPHLWLGWSSVLEVDILCGPKVVEADELRRERAQPQEEDYST